MTACASSAHVVALGQEYEAEIISGDIIAIAEVVRDVCRSESQPVHKCSLIPRH